MDGALLVRSCLRCAHREKPCLVPAIKTSHLTSAMKYYSGIDCDLCDVIRKQIAPLKLLRDVLINRLAVKPLSAQFLFTVYDGTYKVWSA